MDKILWDKALGCSLYLDVFGWGL